MKIVVIDGQGGALGKSVIAALKKQATGAEILAVGTNGAATTAMLAAGADHGATGENPVVVACADADVIVGPIGILAADSMFGEVTPRMALAVGRSRAKKILIPVSRCNIAIAGAAELPYADYVRLAAEAAAAAANARESAIS